MARITVEDCIKIIPNRFELCLIASNRAKNIIAGAQTIHDRKEKAAVISLREIADDSLNLDTQRENVARSFKNHSAIEEFQPEQSIVDAIADESESSTNQEQNNQDFIAENIQVED